MSTKKKLLEAAAGNAGEAVYADDVFSTYLYEGNGALRDIENGIDLAGEGGMVWIKGRESTNGNVLFDTERGPNKFLYSYTNTEEFSGASLSGFNSNGFELASGNTQVNPTSAESMVSWTFRKQPGFFDIVTYTGNGGSNRAISHNLGSKPGLVIIKDYGQSAGWMVGTGFTSTQYYRLALETSAAASGGGLANYNNYLSAEPTTTTFSVGNEGLGNANGQTYVAYLFANDAQDFGTDSDESIIKCGSYIEQTGDNAVDLGFEPQFLLIKKASSTSNWWMIDTMRGFTADGDDSLLRADTSDSEAEGAGGNWELTPTGFAKYESSGSGATWIFMAIRRPHKPAEEFAATDLFNTVQGASSTANPGFNLGIAPDMAWQKAINGSADGHYIGSRMTGSKYMFTNSTASEATGSSIKWDYMNGWVDYFSGMNAYNAWGFKRAPGFFDVVAYAGTGGDAAGKNKPHNLGVIPEMMWVKTRSNTYNWYVYHKDIGATNFLVLNTDAAKVTASFTWENTAPTATTFHVSSDGTVNGSSSTYIAYLFATVAGISKVGSYTGNGGSQDINCGFTNGAKFVLIKCTSSGGPGSNWYVWDSLRGIGSGNDPYLALNNSLAQEVSFDALDTLPAGFTIKQAGPNVNQSGEEYIFYAIA